MLSLIEFQRYSLKIMSFKWNIHLQISSITNFVFMHVKIQYILHDLFFQIEHAFLLAIINAYETSLSCNINYFQRLFYNLKINYL